jgi:hypothetical protein
MVILKTVVIFAVLATVGIQSPVKSPPQSTPKQRVTESDDRASAENSAHADRNTHDSPNVTATATQEKTESHQTNESKDDENIAIQRKLASFTFWLIIVGAIQAGILAATVYVVYLQVSASRNSERAWILPKALVSERHSHHRDGIDVIVNLRNYGKTPAWIVERSFRCVRFSDEAVKSLAYDPPITSECGEPVAPDGDFPEIRCPIQLSEDLVGRLGVGTVIIYGYVKYRDPFCKRGRPRETRVRMRFDRTQDDIIRERDSKWVYDGPPEANRHT